MNQRTSTAHRARHEAILAEVAQEEAETEIAEKATTLDMPLHLRIDRELDETEGEQAFGHIEQL